MPKFEKLKTFEPLPKSVTIKKSSIHGIGLFSTEKISSNTELGITHIKDERFSHGYIRTPLGGFFNHSKQPNSRHSTDLSVSSGTGLQHRPQRSSHQYGSPSHQL